MTEGIRDFFTCENCQWCEQCRDPLRYICEYYDSVDEFEAEIEEMALIEIKRQQYSLELEELVDEIRR